MNKGSVGGHIFKNCRLFPEQSIKQILYWLVIFIACTGFCFYYYSYTLDFWWSHDDAHHLLFERAYSPLGVVLYPDIYRKFHDLHYAPWNILIYYMNVALFDYDIKWFFVRQLASVSLLAFVSFIFLRHWLGTRWSLFGVALFVISPPCVIVVSQLMNGHYLEGMVFAITAASFFIVAVRKQSMAMSILGALFYFLATASKEIFVPIPLLLICIPVSELRQRLVYWLPYLLVSVFYYFWRSYFIADSFSLWIYDLEVPGVITLPFRLIEYVFGQDILSIFAAIVIASLLLYTFITYSRTRPLIFSALILLITPLLPVYNASQPARFHVLVAFSVVAFLVILSAELMQKNNGFKHFVILLNLFIGIVMILQSSGMIEVVKRENHNYASVGKFVLFEDPAKKLYIPNHKLAASHMRKLRKELGQGNAPEVYYDIIQLKAENISENLYRFDLGSGTIDNITSQQEAIFTKWQNRIRKEKLEVSLEKLEKGIRWKFGPYEDSRYDVLLLTKNEAYTKVRYKGIYRWKLPPMSFIVRYNSPQGWITYSEELEWTDDPGEKLSWSRN